MARELVCIMLRPFPVDLHGPQLLVLSFPLRFTTGSTFQYKMDSTLLSHLLNFHSNRSGEVSVGSGHGRRLAVVLLTTDGTALACGFDEGIGHMPYVETHVTTSFLLDLVDSLIVKAEAVYHRRRVQGCLFEEHRIQELTHHKSILNDSISQARIAF